MKVYQLAGESAALYNGAQDTDGGIWIRLRDENDRRILAAAVEKQLKNQQAATGTLTALDPNASHLVDYVADALNRIKDGVNGARPATAQLDGTPMGAELAANGDEPGTPAKKGRGGKKGGAPTPIGEVLATMPAGAVAGAPDSDGIQWADDVPSPRPARGDVLRLVSGQAVNLTSIVGYDKEHAAFRVFDSGDWSGLVNYHEPSKEWRVMSDWLSYPESTEPAATVEASSIAAGETSGNPADHAAGTVEASEISAGTVDTSGAPVDEFPADALYDDGTAEATPEPESKPAGKPSAQRQRNAAANGLKKPSGKKGK